MNATEQFPDARVPSVREVQARGNLIVQMWRFTILNLKMLRMITNGHH